MGEMEKEIEMGEGMSEGRRDEGIWIAEIKGDEVVTMTGTVAETAAVGMMEIREGVGIGEGTTNHLPVMAIGTRNIEIVPGTGWVTGMGDEIGGTGVIVIGVALSGAVGK